MVNKDFTLQKILGPKHYQISASITLVDNLNVLMVII